jgi:hypothetical protein
MEYHVVCETDVETTTNNYEPTGGGEELREGTRSTISENTWKICLFEQFV